MKQHLLLLSGSLLALSAIAQMNTQDPDYLWCTQHQKMAEMQANDPERFATVNHLEVPQNQEKTTGTVYIVPVVFHILHNNGSENISEAQIQDQINILNRDYRLLNADASGVQTPFQGMPSDVEIEFRLATVAPNGNCFSGITRTLTSLTNNGSSGQAQVDAVVAGNDVYQGIWPHNQYLNVYIAKEIGGAAGYTFNPAGNAAATSQNMYYNGIFLLHDYCGSIGTSSVTTSRALTHEIGHWFNLSHTWGDNNDPGTPASCSIDDHVQDTPMCIGVTSCTLNSNTCDDTNDPSNFSSWTTNVIDNVENYMDYSYCSKMFTQGQVDRMRTAIISTTAGRNNIWTAANLLATGVTPGSTLCQLDFNADHTTICSGNTVTYSVNSTNNIATYSWSFPGGTPSTSAAASPTVTYPSAGTYNATLTVTATSNGATYSKSHTSYMTVNTAPALGIMPISEGFTSATFPPTGYSVINVTNGSTTWARSSTVGVSPTAGNSMKFDNWSTPADNGDDEFRTPKLDLTNFSSATLTFSVAYAPYPPAYYDGLGVLVTSDCGETWTSEYYKEGTTLATASATTSQFSPSATQWRTETVDLTDYVGNSAVQLSFKNFTANGNMLYIDNINITGVSGTPAAPVANFSPSATTVCAGTSVTFTNSSTGPGNTYSWSFPGGSPATSTATNPTVTYATGGTYTATLTATNSGGTNTSSQTISVTAAPAAPTITAGGPTSFCAGGNVVLTSSASSGNAWSTGSTSSSVTASTSGTYTVTQTSGGCASAASNAVTVTVNPLPTVSFASVPSPCVSDASFTLTQGTPANGTYSGTGVTGGNVFNPATAGTGNVTLTYSYTDPNGCSASATRLVTVSSCLSLDELSATGLSLFPNPANSFVTIKSTSAQMNYVTVYDQAGRLVGQSKLEGVTEYNLDLTKFANGVYNVEIVTPSAKPTIRLVVSH